MQEYKSIEATFDAIVVNKDELKYGQSPYKFFILVSGTDGKKYQIKFNEDKQRHNINEFISHYIGICSDMPLIEGIFLELDKREILKIKNKISEYGKGYLTRVDYSMMKKSLFFGVEWKQHTTKIDSEIELLKRVAETSNRNSFFSLYSFDQFMKNHDRHLGNHLVVKEGRSKKYCLIDFDRIFASTNWSRVDKDYNCFIPFVVHPRRPYHAFLMNLVQDRFLSFVHDYAGKLQAIKSEDIKDMCDMILDIYDTSNDEVKHIFNWFESRKEHIVMNCLVNEKYFPNIKKGLYSVS